MIKALEMRENSYLENARPGRVASVDGANRGAL